MEGSDQRCLIASSTNAHTHTWAEVAHPTCSSDRKKLNQRTDADQIRAKHSRRIELMLITSQINLKSNRFDAGV